MKTYCFSSVSNIVNYSPAYIGGASNFAILSSFAWVTINNTTGELDIELEALPVDVYVILVSYDIGTGENIVTETQAIYLSIEDCEVSLFQTEFKTCEGNGTVDFQLMPTNGLEYSDFSIDPLVTGLSVSPTGVLSVDSDVLSIGATTAQISFNSGLQIITITLNNISCIEPLTSITGDCPNDSLAIVWVNQEGGRQSYWFNQVKEYRIEQKDSKQWVNKEKEKRHFSRGTVEDAVIINQDFVPEAHLLSLNSLKNSIQAWVTNDIDNQLSYKSIYIDEDSWTVKRSNSRFFRISFTFKYSIAKVIQKQ